MTDIIKRIEDALNATKETPTEGMKMVNCFKVEDYLTIQAVLTAVLKMHRGEIQQLYIMNPNACGDFVSKEKFMQEIERQLDESPQG